MQVLVVFPINNYCRVPLKLDSSTSGINRDCVDLPLLFWPHRCRSKSRAGMVGGWGFGDNAYALNDSLAQELGLDLFSRLGFVVLFCSSSSSFPRRAGIAAYFGGLFGCASTTDFGKTLLPRMGRFCHESVPPKGCCLTGPPQPPIRTVEAVHRPGRIRRTRFD